MAADILTKRGLRVLVSGAGIAGPTLAWFLARSGARVTVVERSPQLLSQGQNIDLRGTALNIVHRMGILDAIRRCTTTEKGTAFVDQHDRAFATFPVGESASVLTAEYEILRSDLANILYQAAVQQPGVDFRFGTTIERVAENGDSAVRVELSSGEEEESDVLVLADGQWSTLRKQVFGTDGLEVVDKNCFFVYFRVSRTEEDDDYARVYMAPPARMVITRPDNHGTTRALLSIRPGSAAQKQQWEAASRSRDRSVQVALIKSAFSDVGWKVPRLLRGIDTADDLFFQSIQQIRMTKWHRNRIVCLGDTAYAPTPFTGMGTSLAIDGAYLLAGHLSQLEPGQRPALAFDRYDHQFRPFVVHKQTLPFYVPAIRHPKNAVSKWAAESYFAARARMARMPWAVKRSAETHAARDRDLVADIDAPFPSFPAFERA
ncbi:2-polyprenyl-6-methoxyphenol hydroxylase-like oxidoreductase protein [Moesziomyces antarcticus]|uniref:FAD-binding domain-containing protein n=1 Tax=Pseudozyma antarctica TaxID=84753 RepID=A0A5C3FH21_PSEA2|nr:2-polyprenyl-6-methoxyphenol hydroxylase-like oxidoreductase protein [Moesziomyces antarcticus]GAK62462.1 2-polyprenyl-6-methoxyphenol hydroxylase-like oxidoreductase protein [Moesziomyces antarcticus]SPO43017.1 uncharacterized protein PSANT_00701 [Moesziomyces antarcticus]